MRVQERHAALPSSIVFVLCGWFATVIVHLRSFRHDVSDRGRKWVFGLLLVVGFYAMAERQFKHAEFLRQAPTVC